MKYCTILFALIALQLQAQTVLKFDKRFVQCEDKWVAHKMNKEDSDFFMSNLKKMEEGLK